MKQLVKSSAKSIFAATACAALVSACAPDIDLARSSWKAPEKTWDGPTVQVLVNHLTCELANSYQKSRRSQDLTPDMWDRLNTDHFIATVDLNLLVTHTENANPSLSFITPLTAAGDVISPVITTAAVGQTATAATYSRTLSVGLQLSGTQDNSLDLQYVIDLQKVLSASDWYPIYVFAREAFDRFRAIPAGTPGTADYDQVQGARASALSDVARAGIKLDEALQITPNGDPGLTAVVQFPKSDPLMAENAAKGIVDQLRTLSQGYIPCANEPSRTFTMGLSGNLGLETTINDGLNAIDATSAYNIYGSSGPTTMADSSIPFPKSFVGKAAAPGKSGGTPQVANGSGTTSFSAKVDFNVVQGLNGGPSWTLLQFKGPSGGGGGGSGTGGSGGSSGGGGQLLGFSRTATDTLSITFAPTCRVNDEIAIDATNTLQKYDGTDFSLALPPDVISTEKLHVLQAGVFTYLTSKIKGAELSFEQVQWSGMVTNADDKTRSVMLIGTISSGLSGSGGVPRPLGRVVIRGLIPDKGTQIVPFDGASTVGTMTEDAASALTSDGRTASYWDTIQGCDVTTGSAIQGIIDNAVIQNRYQRLPLSVIN